MGTKLPVKLAVEHVIPGTCPRLTGVPATSESCPFWPPDGTNTSTSHMGGFSWEAFTSMSRGSGLHRVWVKKMTNLEPQALFFTIASFLDLGKCAIVFSLTLK